MSVLTEGQRLGVYRIVRLLGEGGMGAVYEARQEPLERRVALKTLHADHAKSKEFIARFFNEAKVLSRLEHPSLVQVSDFGHTADGTAYLVMEYLHGQSLGRRIRDLAERGERLPIAMALHIGVQVADVLSIAHAQGIAHRDIKPDNVMLVVDPVAASGERVKVLDFGIAKLSDDKGGVKTATDQVMGTPAYMSPEQCAGAGGVDAQTDVYALGCVLYELLAGRTPFVADGAGRLIGMHLFQEPPQLLSVADQVPRELAELVHLMLRKEKLQRPTMKQAGEELARQLSQLSGGLLAMQATPNVVSKSDQKMASPNAAHASTIGRSLGQRVNRPVQTRSGIVLGSASVLAMGLIAALSVSIRPALKPQPPLPATQPGVVQTPEPVKERLELGAAAPASAQDSPGKEPKAKAVTARAATAKPKPPAGSKVAPRVEPARPANTTPAKKRFGYEE